MRYPDATIKASMHPTVYGALDNLLFPDAVDASYPAPIGTSNLEIASTQVAGSEITLDNYSATSTTFENFIIQSGDAQRPYYRSTSHQFEYESDYVTLEGGVVGFQWGIITNSEPGQPCDGELNDIDPLWGPGWKLTTTAVNDAVRVSSLNPDVSAGDFYLSVIGYTAGVSYNAFCDAGGVATVNIPVAQQCLIQISQIEDKGPRKWSVIAADSGFLSARLSPLSPYNLKSHQFADMQFINARSNRCRLNSHELVVTSTIANLYEGGSILSSKIVSNMLPSAPNTGLTWDAFLYAQKKKYLSNLEFGAHLMWFPTYSEWILTPAKGPSNPFAGSGVVNICKITYPSPNGVAVPTLPVQIKSNGWIDYTTNDATIPTTPGLIFIDDWLTAVSIMEACYVFTDNPTHNKLKETLMKAARFIVSGDPRAVALRKAGMTAIKTGLGLALAI